MNINEHKQKQVNNDSSVNCRYYILKIWDKIIFLLLDIDHQTVSKKRLQPLISGQIAWDH